MRFFYHRYLILVSWNSVSMLVLLLMLPVLPTHRDPKVKEEGLVPSGRIRARGMMGSKEEGKLDRMMRKSSNRVTLKWYRNKQQQRKHKVKSSGLQFFMWLFHRILRYLLAWICSFQHRIYSQNQKKSTLGGGSSDRHNQYKNTGYLQRYCICKYRPSQILVPPQHTLLQQYSNYMARLEQDCTQHVQNHHCYWSMRR